MKAISVRIKHVGRGKAGFQRRHDARLGKQPEYVDGGRQHLNSVLIEPATPAQLRQVCTERVAAQEGRQRALKSDAAVATIGVLTFSRDAQKALEGLSAAEQDQRIRESCEAVAAEMGSELTGLVVHRDEQAIHAHFQVPARRADGQPISKTVDTRRLQDVAAEAWKDLGITRGKPKAERVAAGEPYSTWRHRTVKQLHEDLPKEIEAAQEAERQARMRLAKTQAALAAAAPDSDRAMKLRKRIIAYERRLVARQSELAAAESALESISKRGSRLGAFLGGIRDALRGTARELQRWKDLAIAESAAAKEATAAAAAAVAEGRTARGRASALQHQLAKSGEELSRYKKAAAGLPPEAVSQAVKERAERRATAAAAPADHSHDARSRS